MARLEELQRALHATLRGEVSVGDGAARLGVAASRLGIYQGFVAHHIRAALDKIYPYVRALLGESAWGELSAAFFAEVPARDWELNAAVEPFAAFLDARLRAGDTRVHPFHVALAQLEWEELAVYLARAEVPAPQTLDAPVINPTTSLLELPYAVIPFVVAHPDPAALTPNTPLPARQPMPQVAILFRRRVSHHVAYYHGSDDLLFALKVVHEGVPLEAAADATHQPLAVARAALDEATRVGLVIAPAPVA